MSADKELSIIIPVHPEESHLPYLLTDLDVIKDTEIEIIISGPEVNQLQLTDFKKDIQTITSKLGRARQMNAGAKIAQGKNLLFLHADSRLPADSFAELFQIIKTNKQKNTLFYFKLAFHKESSKLMKLNSICANLRSKFLSLPFGDQAFCMDKEMFWKLGGFSEGCLQAEDILFVKNCKRNKIQIKAINAVLSTSARKYEQYGWLNTTFQHLLITCSHVCNKKIK